MIEMIKQLEETVEDLEDKNARLEKLYETMREEPAENQRGKQQQQRKNVEAAFEEQLNQKHSMR
jgi:hypothetical protein